MSGDQRDSFKMPHAPPTKISESKAFREVRELGAKETKSFTFALSGAIPIVQTLPDPFDGQGDNPKNELPTTTHGDWGLPGMAKRLVEKHPRTLDLTHRSPENLRSTHCLPISLIWRGTNKEGARDLTELRFPLEPETEQNLGRLIADMAPATFGVGNRDVLDESYRKAGKMDADQFLTSFNPNEVGIVSTIAQYLLPGLRHAKQSRDVKVELYKLNARPQVLSSVGVRRCWGPANAASRYTRDPQASSKRTSTRLARQPSSVRWWSACRFPIRAALSK